MAGWGLLINLRSPLFISTYGIFCTKATKDGKNINQAVLGYLKSKTGKSKRGHKIFSGKKMSSGQTAPEKEAVRR